MTIDKLMNEQEKLIEKLEKKLDKQGKKDLVRIINIEYYLTMVEEGHELSTIYNK